MKTLEIFYDLSSPWTYLAFNNLQPIIAETEAVVRWRPFLVGGVFNAVNREVYKARAEPMAPKIVHNYRWLHEWARLAQLPLVFPTAHHPLKSVLAMRCCCALEENPQMLLDFSLAAFRSYFAHGNNIDEHDVLVDIANGCGVDGATLLQQAATQPVKDRLRAHTEEAISRGAYGSPTMFINEQLYFGNDQLPLVRQALLDSSDS